MSSLRVVIHILKNEVLVESSVVTTLTTDIKNVFLIILKEGIETSEIMDLSRFLDPQFITGYTLNSYLTTVKDRLVSEGSDIHKEITAVSNRSAKCLESDKDKDDDDTVKLYAKQRKLSSWLKADSHIHA